MVASEPPGTIRVDDNLFVDKTEVTNFSWLEYLYWIEKVFGGGSEEYRDALPDTAAWLHISRPDSILMVTYLRHPAYRDYPVVGVTHEQALAYSKWRSDRVFEILLIKRGIIPYEDDQTRSHHFSIEDFYAADTMSAYHFFPFPEYDLPTENEWTLIRQKADSVNRINIRHCRLKKPLRGWTSCRDLISGGKLLVNSLETADTLDHLRSVDCFGCREPLIFHLLGNVRELSKDPAVAVGGGWTDPISTILETRSYEYQGANAWTGFRNVCRWKGPPHN